MNQNWSEYHQRKAMIDKLQRKLDDIKRDFDASFARQRGAQTFKRIVDRLPGCGIKHDTAGFCFLCNQVVGPGTAEEEQIGGS